MTPLGVAPYKLKVHLGEWHVKRRYSLSRSLFGGSDTILSSGNMCIWTFFWSLNFSYNAHSYPVTAYLLLWSTANSQVFVVSFHHHHHPHPRTPALCKECLVSKNGSFACGNISVLCSWCMNIFFLPFLASSHCSWQ